MFNIRKVFTIFLLSCIFFIPLNIFADEISEDFGGKSDGDFIFFEEESQFETIDLAIEIFKTDIEDIKLEEENISKDEQEEEKKDEIKKVQNSKASYSKQDTNMINYIMKKNPSLSKNTAQQIYDCVIKHTNKHNVDPYLVFAIMEQESTFNPNTSYKGAYGLMQIYYTTFPYLGITMEEVYDIDKNISAGVREISGNIKMFTDYTTALSAYNWGSGNVKRGTYNTKYANRVLNKKSIIENIVKAK